jgi:hypothetical protein
VLNSLNIPGLPLYTRQLSKYIFSLEFCKHHTFEGEEKGDGKKKNLLEKKHCMGIVD